MYEPILLIVVVMYALHGGYVWLQLLTQYFHFKRVLAQSLKVHWPIYNRLRAGRYPGRDNAAGIATTLQAGRSVGRAGGNENFRTRRDRPWGPTNLLCSGYRGSV
jgi:hypothetical protein